MPKINIVAKLCKFGARGPVIMPKRVEWMLIQLLLVRVVILL